MKKKFPIAGIHLSLIAITGGASTQGALVKTNVL